MAAMFSNNDDLVKETVKMLEDQKRAYKEDVHNLAYRNRLGEAYEKIHSLGSALEEAKQFGTEQDYKAVATSWRSAKDAYSDLLQLEDEMPYNEDLDNEALNSKLGVTIDENCTTIEEFPSVIDGLKRHYVEVVNEAIELDEEIVKIVQRLD